MNQAQSALLPVAAAPGVQVIRPTDVRPYYQLRYRDPITGTTRQSKLAVGTETAAREQARQISDQLQALRAYPASPALPPPPAPKAPRVKQAARTKGVSVLPPSSRRPYYSLRHKDPATGRVKQYKLPGVGTAAAAAAAAEALSQTLQKRLLQIVMAGGKEHSAGVTLLRDESEAYVAFVATKVNRHGKRTSKCTLSAYTRRLEEFCDWCEGAGVTQLAQLTLAGLSAWFTYRRTCPTQCGTNRGQARAATSFNQDVKPIRQMLVAAARQGRLTHITSDKLREVLARQTEPAPEPRVYSVDEMRAILQAALDYDVSSDRKPNAPAIAPLIAVALLTGMRRGELCRMQVKWVVFDAASAYDASVRTGVDLISIPKAATKTGKLRDVLTTQYSPLLAELLRALTHKRAPQERLLGMGFQSSGAHSRGLRAHGAPPDFKLKDLRSTCATYQSPLPGSHKAKADRQGHTLAVAEQHYLALPTGTPAAAPDLDAVMKCQDLLRTVLERVQAG